LDVLGDLLINFDCRTTTVVRNELRAGAQNLPTLQRALELDWLTTMPLDTVDALICRAKWLRLIGGKGRNRGEASVFAAAEVPRRDRDNR
jgi:hypothetical protein